MKDAFFMRVCAVSSAFVLIGVANAQEVPFVDYLQPLRPTKMGFASMDNSAFWNVGVTAYSVGVNFHGPGYFTDGIKLNNWPTNGDSAQNGKSGLGVPMYGTFPKGMTYLNFTFMYNPETGAPRKYRLDIYNGEYWDYGAPNNGGVITLSGTVGAWSRARLHRLNTSTDGYGNTTKPTATRLVAIQNADNNFPGFGGTYLPAAAITFDTVRITPDRRLSGLFKITGTTNKNLGTILFDKNGGLFQYNDWIQNLGNVDIVNVYGTTNFGNLSTTTFSSNLVYTYDNNGSTRQFGIDRLSSGLNSVGANLWAGMGVSGNPSTDKFFGIHSQAYPGTSAVMLRQVTTGVYTHYFRTMDNSNGYAAEVPVNIGGENIVAMADVNGDGMDDVITRSGTNFKSRVWTGETGTWPNKVPTYAAATTLSIYGYLKVVAVTDLDDDGTDDLLLTDNASGDVFCLLMTPAGGSLKWLFQLNSAMHEKIFAVTDADNDGLPDIYSTRQRTSDLVGEINIRKPAATGMSIASFGKVSDFNYTTLAPAAIGDTNGDGSSDVIMIANDAPYYSLISYLVNPNTRGLLQPSKWISNAGTTQFRPIYFYGDNE